MQPTTAPGTTTATPTATMTATPTEATAATATGAGAAADELATGLVDCDVHPQLRRGMADLKPYLSTASQRRLGIGEQVELSGHGGREPVTVPRNLMYVNPAGTIRRDAYLADGAPIASDSAHVARHHLDAHQISRAVLVGGDVLGLGAMPDPDLAAAIASGYNEWLSAAWLETDRRYRAALVVAPQDPVLAAAEIRRVGPRAGFVSVLMPLTNILMGQRHHYPIYEAAAELGLPITIHPNSAEGIFTTGPALAGAPPTYYVEWHTGLSQVFQANLISLVCHGVFERFPALKVVITEGGIAWLPDVLWRLDKNVKGLRDEVPWIRRLPSEYVFDHVRFTTQPLPEPRRRSHLHTLCDITQAGRTLMFSSDFPHWDFDDPAHALRALPPEILPQVRSGTAIETYGDRL
jgi:predicted TIM-barrel fold metal-dependent hydrolase